jgi:hypothetical protein
MPKSLLGTLAFTYGQAGRLEAALATAKKGRDLALAGGQKDLAERLHNLMEAYNPRPARR